MRLPGPTGLPARCLGVFQAKNGRLIGLTDLSVGFADLIYYVLAVIYPSCVTSDVLTLAGA